MQTKETLAIREEASLRLAAAKRLRKKAEDLKEIFWIPLKEKYLMDAEQEEAKAKELNNRASLWEQLYENAGKKPVDMLAEDE